MSDTLIVCSKCERKQATKPTKDGAGTKLPGGWKRQGEAVTCDRCWEERYVLRAVTVPVASVESLTPPRSKDAEDLGHEGWKRFRPALRESQLAALRVSNWAVAQLAQSDLATCATARAGGQEKIPAMARQYLYPGATALAPELSPSTVTAILRSVERRYRARRYHALWLCREALPTYRDPAPVPVPAQAVTVLTDEHGVVRLRVPVGRSGSWTLRLSGARGHQRALALLRQVASGDLEHGEVALLEVAGREADHRPTGPRRGGARSTRLVAKITVWRPRELAKGLDGTRTLRVHTDAESLLVWSVEGEERVQRLNEDAVKRWVMAHDRQLQREREDLRASPPERREVITRAREDRLRLHRARMDTHAKQVCALVRDAAVRLRCGVVEYDDAVKSYMDYPWHSLRERLQILCHEAGITLRLASAEVASEGQGPLATSESGSGS